jgi:hypothetical protein
VFYIGNEGLSPPDAEGLAAEPGKMAGPEGKAGRHMRHGETSIQSQRTKKVRIIERRAGVRYPCTRTTFYPPVGERRADLWWEGAVLSLRTTRVVLVLGRRFEVGTILEVDLHKLLPTMSGTWLIRVAHVKAKDNNGWVVNGDFLLPLDPDDLQEQQSGTGV